MAEITGVDPKRFNAETLARMLLSARHTGNNWQNVTGYYKIREVDCAQRAIDAMVAEGILKTDSGTE